MNTKISRDYLKGQLDKVFKRDADWTDLQLLNTKEYDTTFLYFLRNTKEISLNQIMEMQDDFARYCNEDLDDFEIYLGVDEYLYIQFALPNYLLENK
jgi:hypothetical protein